MNVLVAVASKHGSTDGIAEAIADVLVERGFRVTKKPVALCTGVDGFDAVVLGSGVYAGRWLRPAKEFVERSGPALRSRPVWLFSSGPLGDPPKPDEDPEEAASMRAATGARDHRVFDGCLSKKELSFAERAMVRAVKAPYGDFRDWDAIRSWAEEIAAQLEEERKSA